MSTQNAKQSLADIRLFLGYTESDPRRLNESHQQQLAVAKERLLRCRACDLLDAFMQFRRSGLSPIKPEVSYTQMPEKSEPPAHRQSRF